MCNDDGTKVSARCLKCTFQFGKTKQISGSLGVTSNFVKHLKRKHPDHYIEFQDKQKQLVIEHKKKKKKQTVIELTTNPPPADLVKKYIPKLFHGPPTQAQVDELVKDYIVKSMRPLKTVEEEQFIKLVTGLSPGSTVMTRKTLKRRIFNEGNNMKKRIKETLRMVKFLCLTADIWSARNRSFLGVTCHWMDQNLNRHSTALACYRFKGGHTFDKIASLLIQTFEEFEIDQDKIVCIVTDNGSNFVKSFRVYGKSDDVSGDEEEETFDDILDLNSPTEPKSDFVFHDASIILDNSSGQTANDSPVRIVLPKHQRCAAHTLSLVASTDSENSVGTEYKRILRSSMGKCSALWNSNSRPKSAEIIKARCGKLLVTPCKTRWNSLYDSIRRLLDPDVKPNLDSICVALNIPKFSKAEIGFLEEYKKVTASICQGLDILQGDLFIGVLLPTITTIKLKLTNSLTDATLCYTKPLAKALLDGLVTRFKSHFDLALEQRDCILSTICHPFFKLKWVESNKKDQIDNLKKIFVDEVTKMASQRNENEERTSPHQIEKPTNDFFEFASDLEDINGTNNSAVRDRCELECLQYLGEKSTSLQILDQYPSVKELFIKYNTPIPSSAPVERFFSFGGLILSSKRRRLTDETFQHLLLAKCNPKMK